MTFDAILHLIEQHGLSLVLLILLIFWLRPKIDLLWKSQVADRKQKAEENVENFVRFDLAAKSLLREALHDFNADWAAVWQFHNGVHGVGKNRVPFMYLSMTHEVHSPSTTALMPSFRDIPLSMIDSRTLSLFVRSQIVVHDYQASRPVEDLAGMARIMNELGARHGYNVPIRDEDGNLCAIFSVAFSAETFTLDADGMNSLQIFGRRLAWYMANLGVEPSEDELNALKK